MPRLAKPLQPTHALPTRSQTNALASSVDKKRLYRSKTTLPLRLSKRRPSDEANLIAPETSERVLKKRKHDVDPRERRGACMTLSPAPSDDSPCADSPALHRPFVHFDRLPSPVSHTEDNVFTAEHTTEEEEAALSGEEESDDDEEEQRVPKMMALMRQQDRFPISRVTAQRPTLTQSSQTGEEPSSLRHMLSPPSSLRFSSPDPPDEEEEEEDALLAKEEEEEDNALPKEEEVEPPEETKQSQFATLLSVKPTRSPPAKLTVDTTRARHAVLKPTAMMMLLLSDSSPDTMQAVLKAAGEPTCTSPMALLAHVAASPTAAETVSKDASGSSNIPMSPWVSQKSEMETLAEASSVPHLPSLLPPEQAHATHFTAVLREKATRLLAEERPATAFSEEELEWAQLKLLSHELTLRLQLKKASLQQWQKEKRKQKPSPYVHYVMSNGAV